ncbi:hypothetical protein DFH09DRAFT_1325063 [Mycena vulgaris]|nr:hypothetical protein DFH09DRAFT_1325063 [Mycena vulgaris]
MPPRYKMAETLFLPSPQWLSSQTPVFSSSPLLRIIPFHREMTVYGFLVKTLVLSINPYKRGWMINPQKETSAPAFTLGEPIVSFGVGLVLRSEHPDVAPRRYISGMAFPHQEYFVVPGMMGLIFPEAPEAEYRSHWDNVGGEVLDAALEHAALYARNAGIYQVITPILHLTYAKSLTISVFAAFRLTKYEEEFYTTVLSALANGEFKYSEDDFDRLTSIHRSSSLSTWDPSIFHGPSGPTESSDVNSSRPESFRDPFPKLVTHTKPHLSCRMLRPSPLGRCTLSFGLAFNKTKRTCLVIIKVLPQLPVFLL